MSMPSPQVVAPPQGMPASAPVAHGTPFPTLSMPAPTLTQPALDPTQADLISYLQKRAPDLPQDVRQRVQTASRKQGKRVIKDLQVAAKALGDARTVYEEAVHARIQHLTTWKAFLAEAVKNWKDYAERFASQESALQERIAAARENFKEAKECLDTSKTSAGSVTEISDDEDLPGESETSAMQICTSIQNLSNSLQQLSKEAEAIHLEAPSAKRPRIEEVREDEVESKVKDQPFS